MKDKSSTLPTVLSSREALALATFLTAGHAAAQAPAAPDKKTQGPSGETLPEVQVTANRQNQPGGSYKVEKLDSQKFTAPLVDTPQTFSVIPKEVFQQQGARNLTDVLKNTPGISYNAGENGFGTNANNFSLRGVDTSGSIFQDGVRDSGSYSRDVFNLESVEIGKGAAADNGYGTAGGYVNLVSKTARAENFYSGTTSYSFDETDSSPRFRTAFDVNQAFSGNVAFRLNAFLQEGGVAGRDYAEANGWGLAPTITFGLGTDTRYTLSYQHVEQNDIPDWGVPTGISAGGANNFEGVDRSHRDTFYGLTSDYDDTITDAFVARIEHDFNEDLTLSNQTRIAKTNRRTDFTMPHSFDNAAGTTVRQERTIYDRENFSFSNITNLSYEFATGSLEHTLSAGFEFIREDADAQRYGSTNRAGVDAHDPNNNPGIGNPAFQGIGQVDVETYGLYVYDTVKINERWQVTGGIRADHYKVDLVDRNQLGVPGGANFSKSDTFLGGKLGVVHKPASNGSIYASAGLSSQPPASFLSNSDASRGGGNGFPGAGLGINNKDAKTQYNLNYEIGTKWDFLGGRLSTTAALFRTERHDVAISGRPTVAAGGATDTGYHEQIIQGIELGVAGQITDEWSVFGGLLIMDSERKVSSKWEQQRINASTGAGEPEYNAAYNSFDGDELAFTPNYTGNLWTTYRFPIGLTVGGGMQYVSGSYIGRPDDAERIVPNGRYGKMDDYLVFNTMLAYEVTQNVTVRLNVDNIFDEVYAVSSNWSGVRSNVGPPRTYTISADWKF
ncbi:MAG: TonB-dependent receptor [Akkermansiaceae bacterium]|nr:TonB-dependent receptor [Akkermansiaceae bacterium]